MIHVFSNGLLKKLLPLSLLILSLVGCNKSEGESIVEIDNSLTPVNHAPTILDKSFSVDNHSILQGKATAVDLDGDSLRYSVISDVSHGVLSFSNDGSFSYQASSGFHGEDSFSLGASDGNAFSNIAKYTIQVTVNPIISGIYKVTRLNNPITFSMNSNGNVFGDLVFSIAEQPKQGHAEFNDDNTITYTPIQNSIGLDEFKVQASDRESVVSAIVTIDNNLSFKGQIVPDSVDDVVVLLTGDGYLLTVKPDSSGEFKFYGLPDGDYAVKIRKIGYKSSVAKNFTLDITQINQLQSNIIDVKKIQQSKSVKPLVSSATVDNNFVLEALDSNNFSFHWEEDLSTAGYEYSTYVNEPLIIEFLDEQLAVIDVSAAHQLQHDLNIILVDSGDMKWTQEHAYRLAEAIKTIPQEQIDTYKSQSLLASKWQLMSGFVENGIKIKVIDGHKVIVISDDIFVNSMHANENKRKLFYSQRLHNALIRFVTDKSTNEENLELISDYVFPGKIKRLDINVDGLPEDNKTIAIEIEIHALDLDVEGAQSAFVRVFSEIGTFTDVYLKPVNINGEQLGDGELSTILKGSFTLSKYAKAGFWRTQKIVITDFMGNEFMEKANDFGWKLFVDNPLAKGLIFSENFDSQTDWATKGRRMLGELPTNWDAGRTHENWHPDDGDIGTQPSMQINGNDLSKVYGDSGKAFITHSESYNDTSNNGFTSDGFITKDIPSSNEVYLEFKIKFQNGWATDAELGMIKLVRILHWDGPDSGTGERHKFFTGGNSAPMYIFDWSQNSYGVRHVHAFRCDQQETNYKCTTPAIADPPRQINSGDMSANYNSDVAREIPEIPDLVNGGILDHQSVNYHNQVWGDTWHTVGIHVKLNSSAGVQDGIYQYWLDGQKMISMLQVPWIGTDGDINAKWNSVSFGGNDLYHFDLVGAPADRERWYAFDDIKVYDKLPEWLLD